MAIKKIFKRELLSNKAKLKLHWAVIRPVITYASETWILQESMKGKLFITERKTLRIFGPARDGDGTWIIKTNDELNNLVRNRNIITYNTAQRWSFFGPVCRMTNDRMVKNWNLQY
jgi:hypothetical protein